MDRLWEGGEILCRCRGRVDLILSHSPMCLSRVPLKLGGYNNIRPINPLTTHAQLHTFPILTWQYRIRYDLIF